jgi:hypothetical protein
MPEEIAEGKPVRRRTKTRQFYGFVGITKYDEELLAELEMDLEAGRDDPNCWLDEDRSSS